MPEKKKAVVPRLRFPEFRNAGPWEVKQLGEVVSIANGLSVVQNNEPPGIKVTRIETISDGFVNITKVGYIKSLDDIESYKLQVGDILFSHINSLDHIGKCAFVDQPFDLYHGMNLLRFQVHKRDSVPKFIYYVVCSEPFRSSIRSRANQAVNQASINQTEVGRSRIALPPFLEQQKIADCLSSLDELIELEAKKLEALQAHKKGLMQQLFPREGETTPRLRFPEFRDAGPWEVKRLGEIVEIINERAGDKKCTLLSVTAGIGLVSQVEKFGREIAGKQRRNYFILRKNDFAYNKSATKDYPEGYIGLYEGDEIAAVPNSIFVCFRPAQEKVVPRYLRFLFEINVHGRWMRRFITVGARAHGSLNIDNHNLLHIPIPLPATAVSIPEQQKIADCLSSLDELIELEAKKLEALKAHKKGLMQQLFPQEIDL